MVTAHLINDPESLIGTFFHLPTYPNAAESLQTLKKIASLVKPIMRKHNFRISKLAEFYPEMQPNLLGLNTSFPGSSHLPIIQLRLRKPHNPAVFLDYEAVVQTMLHELSHCVHGPHDDKFWAMFRSLQSELDTLRFSGYTGEGFMGKGEALGSVPRGLSRHEAKQRAREAAEQRRRGDQGRGRVLGSGSLGPIRWVIEDVPGGNSKLKRRDGGSSSSSGGGNNGRASAPPTSHSRSPYAKPNDVAGEAALKRHWNKAKENAAAKGKSASPSTRVEPTDRRQTGVCSGVRHSTTEEVDREIAQMHGFESVTDMESANERAIMQAAIELLEEADREEERLKSREREQAQPSSSSSSRPVDVIDLTSSPSPPPPVNRTQSAPVNPHPTWPSAPIISPGWSCPVCTFVNEESHLQCDLCRVERNTQNLQDSETAAQIIALRDFERRKSAIISKPSAGRNDEGYWTTSPGSSGRNWINEATTGTHHNNHNNNNNSNDRSSNNKGKARSSAPLNTGVTMNGQPTWKCHSCGWLMSQEWWSCGNCQTVKLQS